MSNRRFYLRRISGGGFDLLTHEDNEPDGRRDKVTTFCADLVGHLPFCDDLEEGDSYEVEVIAIEKINGENLWFKPETWQKMSFQAQLIEFNRRTGPNQRLEVTSTDSQHFQLHVFDLGANTTLCSRIVTTLTPMCTGDACARLFKQYKERCEH